MERNKEFERLIEKSRAQIEEREKMIKELIELNAIEEKRRRIEQLTSENALLENESKRLKDLIRHNNDTLQDNMSRRGNHPESRYDERSDRPSGRNAAPDATAELLELTREIRNELARSRSNQSAAPLRNELDSLRHEMRGNNRHEAHDFSDRSAAERQNMIRKLNQEISQIEKDIDVRRHTDAPRHGGSADNQDVSKIIEETRKLRVDLDKQKQDNTKRDRDMSRVISLLEKMSQDDE